jgi:YfiH family protein
VIRFPALEELGLAVAAMSGQEDGDCSLRGADGQPIGKGRRNCCDQLAIDPTALVCADQVHGRNIAHVTLEDLGRGATDPSSAIPATDGLLTKYPGVPLAIMVADCIPVILYDPKVHAGGVLHVGREGTLADISGTGVEDMVSRYGSCPKDIRALIGPGAGPAAYEVSDALAQSFRDVGLPANGRLLDLWAANALQLKKAGLMEAHIATTGICTITDQGFYSHRGQGTRCRNMAIFLI